MLLTDQGEPLSARLFFEDIEVKPAQAVADLLDLIVKDARQDHDAMRFQDTMEFRKEHGNEIGRQITQKQMAAAGSNGLEGTAERPDVRFAVAFDICPGDLRGYGINVTSEDFLRSE